MADINLKPLRAAGLTVRAEPMHAASLRYFDTQGAFASAARAATASSLPDTLRALEGGDGGLVLAWRGPTETLLLTPHAARLAALEAQLGAHADGCLVNLSGALGVLRVIGEPCAELLGRLGGSGCVPGAGEARRARLADVPVLTVSVHAGDTWLVVDRGYAPHLYAWIRETLLDFAAS
jgi:heterotetrameric sarcosine oxidase gamma subunit